MANITLHDAPVHTVGNLPEKGSRIADFVLVASDLSEKTLMNYEGKKKVLNIFPSIDTGTCANAVRKFNQQAASFEDTVVLCISKDLPFAQGRFCTAEGITHVETLSGFRSSFGKDYQVEILDSPLKGLYSRVIIVVDAQNSVVYTEQVPEIVDEPQYEVILQALAAIA